MLNCCRGTAHQSKKSTFTQDPATWCKYRKLLAFCYVKNINLNDDKFQAMSMPKFINYLKFQLPTKDRYKKNTKKCLMKLTDV